MQDPLSYLEGLKQSGINLNLGPVSRLVARLGHPQTRYKTILIGGTNGKGSTAAIISSILMKEGMNVGLYTSPHLRDFRERIRVNGRMIPEDALCTLIDTVKAAVEEPVTYFEFTTVLAFQYFCRCEVDIAVIEVGMGGRLDATNLVLPEVSVITNISMEHQEYLGNKLELIAAEKGGIIKRGGICITAAQGRTVIDVLEKICIERGSSFYRAGRDIRIRRSVKGSFSYYGINKRYRGLRISLLGNHQLKNAALALGVVDIMTGKGMNVHDSSVIEGIRDVTWDGRLELVSCNPKIIADGAHNPAGILSLCNALITDFSYDKLIVVFGVLRDKNYRSMLRSIALLADTIILTMPKSERAVCLKDLLPVASLYHDKVEAMDNSAEALARAGSLAGMNDLVCITGSLYLVGEIKENLESNLPKDRLL